MITKKYIIIAGATVAILAGAVSLAFAENNGMMPSATSMHITEMHGDGGQLPVLQVGPKGEVLMRGTVSAVGATSLTVKSWGGDWTINVSTDTKLLPGTGISQFTVGEFVGIQGVVSQTDSWTVAARLVRDWSPKKATDTNNTMMPPGRQGGDNKPMTGSPTNGGSTDVQKQIQSIIEQINRIKAQLGTQTGQTTP